MYIHSTRPWSLLFLLGCSSATWCLGASAHVGRWPPGRCTPSHRLCSASPDLAQRRSFGWRHRRHQTAQPHWVRSDTPTSSASAHRSRRGTVRSDRPVSECRSSSSWCAYSWRPAPALPWPAWVPSPPPSCRHRRRPAARFAAATCSAALGSWRQRTAPAGWRTVPPASVLPPPRVLRGFAPRCRAERWVLRWWRRGCTSGSCWRRTACQNLQLNIRRDVTALTGYMTL